jgi:hypothetical protein
MANIRNGSRTKAINVCFSFNFAVVFNFQLFPVPPSKATIGDVLTNRQNLATWYMLFFLFYNAHCTESSCVIRRCTGKRKKNPRNKIWKL